MKYESFSSVKRKIPKLINDQTKTFADLKNEVNVNVNLRSETFKKNIVEIPLLKNHLVLQNDTTNFIFHFSNFRVDLLTNCNLLPTFYTTPVYYQPVIEGFDFQNLRLNYIWENVDTINYKLLVQTSKINFTHLSNVVPIYLDLSIFYFNNFTYTR